MSVLCYGLFDEVAGDVMPCVVVGKENKDGTHKATDNIPCQIPHAEMISFLLAVFYLFVDAESESHGKGNDGGNDCRGKMNERHKHTDKGGDYELTEDVELLVAPGLVIANFLCHDN
ncbi:hypothetical protein PvtlMGM2_1109 [Prevotella sp. MGM2]|nr:hypothetical protein PvtlMGM2_1109 [Prevotella sp. MGM2]